MKSADGESKSAHSSTRALGGMESLNPVLTKGCNCNACVAKRENAVSPEVERDAHITQNYWMEIRHVVRCIYRENMSLNNQNKKSPVGSEKMQMIVKKLCSRDPHQFFQRLETLAREYLLEVKVRLLEQLSCGFNSPQLAIEFIQMLLEEYGALCSALPTLLYLLKPLEDCEYVQKLGMTIELMNKNIFRELIFAESFMSSNLPLIIAQLRLTSLTDHVHRGAAEELNQRYIALDQEMEEMCKLWKSAKDHLTSYQVEDRKSHFEKIKADGESFKQQVKLQHSNQSKDIKHEDECSVSTSSPSALVLDESTSPTIVKTIDQPYSNCNGVVNPVPVQKLLQSKIESDVTDEVYKSKQGSEWARLLFKCIKPSADTDFSLSGGVATHTITLLLDTTQLDLLESKPCCARTDLIKYRSLGLEVEEIVEVAMKLSSLRSLGLNIKIEDLFDDEGFSLSVVNGKPVTQDSDDGDCELSADEERDLQEAKENILQRHASCSLLVNGGKTRQQDFLRGLTMKIRFKKTLTVDDFDKHFVGDNGMVTFGSCDQVQMKLTHMEMNSACLTTSCGAVGDVLGLESDPVNLPPMNPLSNKTSEDYVFVHTNSHHEFMDLLLEKRKGLENTIISSEQERRSSMTQMKHAEKSDSKALPRYQVKEQQESNSSTALTKTTREDSSTKREYYKYNFKPLYYTKDSKPCQCSACVGAMATILTTVYRHAASTSDIPAFQCSLSAHLGVDNKLSGDKHLKPALLNGAVSAPNSSTSPLSKEGLWQNWMSTSGSAQLENESHVANSHHHYHHHNGTHCCHCGERSELNGEKFHDRDSSSVAAKCGCSLSGNHHGSSSCLASEGDDTTALAPGNGTAAGESPRRYCPCCYCELFGHNVPPTAPTSHNYTKRRDIMRQKLEEKKKKRREPKSELPNYEEQQTSVEELLAFIEGGDGEEGDLKPTKKQRKKQKKLQVGSNDDYLFHHIHHEAIEEDKDMSYKGTGMETHEVQLNPKRRKHPQSALEQVQNSNKAQERESADVDEYDDELEEFKKFCFADAPTGPRKKIPVTLNMHDIMSKLCS